MRKEDVAKSAELRQNIEELALRLVVGDARQKSEDWIPALERVEQQALREAAPEVAREAAALLEAIRAAGETAAEKDDVLGAGLQTGMVRLQAALDHEPEIAAGGAPADDPELLNDFIVESREHLASVENNLLNLERDPADSEALNAVFRSFHTIKGLAGFLELWEMQKVSHEVETVLDRARSSQWTIDASGTDVILAAADFLRRWLTHVEANLSQRPSQAPEGAGELIGRVRALIVAPSTGVETEQKPAPQAAALASMALALESSAAAGARAASPQGSAPGPRNETVIEKNQSSVVKVDTSKLDYLADMAGEMVIAESLVRHDPDLAAARNQRLQRNLAQLTRITAELQKTAMSLRLVPIGPLFRRMARLVRDLSRQFGKPVEMETGGDEIELDRTIVEELADPLMHMVRNALDHGLEPPQEREKKGKDRTGKVTLKAQHRAGQVVIEIADDGRGLDTKKIRARAIERGIIGPERQLTETEIFNLIFEPGFTTAAQVTNVSGRGVGMDVVRRHIEKLRGRIEIRSEASRGSTFLLKLPLTLAIIDGLVVKVGAERYIVPLFSVREMFRPSQDTVWTVQNRVEMALVRGTLLPVLRLYRRFHVEPKSEDPLQSVMVLAEVEGQRFCLMVDELVGKQEVVIKSLGETFQSVPGVAGGAILGDGRVGLILDLERLYKEGAGEASR